MQPDVLARWRLELLKVELTLVRHTCQFDSPNELEGPIKSQAIKEVATKNVNETMRYLQNVNSTNGYANLVWSKEYLMPVHIDTAWKNL